MIDIDEEIDEEKMCKGHFFFDSGAQVSAIITPDSAGMIRDKMSNVTEVGVFDVVEFMVYAPEGKPALMNIRVDLIRALIIEEINLKEEREKAAKIEAEMTKRSLPHSKVQTANLFPPSAGSMRR